MCFWTSILLGCQAILIRKWNRKKYRNDTVNHLAMSYTFIPRFYSSIFCYFTLATCSSGNIAVTYYSSCKNVLFTACNYRVNYPLRIDVNWHSGNFILISALRKESFGSFGEFRTKPLSFLNTKKFILCKNHIFQFAHYIPTNLFPLRIGNRYRRKHSCIDSNFNDVILKAFNSKNKCLTTISKKSSQLKPLLVVELDFEGKRLIAHFLFIFHLLVFLQPLHHISAHRNKVCWRLMLQH